jgi:hypothetical protein
MLDYLLFVRRLVKQTEALADCCITRLENRQVRRLVSKSPTLSSLT